MFGFYIYCCIICVIVVLSKVLLHCCKAPNNTINEPILQPQAQYAPIQPPTTAQYPPSQPQYFPPHQQYMPNQQNSSSL